ncbi:MAG TPA: nucleotidyltransferase family protein [Pyrinomonadaceae bacterium]|nr:nucleotidyltransferase family protein [Pyrinomonadaceae bacterium]
MTSIKKAVILARGLGTRMRADVAESNLNAEQKRFAEAGIKTLVPIFEDKTLLDFIFENLTAAGFAQICLIIGAEHQAIRDFCAEKPFDISFAIQEKPLGTANAVLAAKDFAKNELFLVVNSDNLYPVEDLRNLNELGQAGLIGFARKGLIEKSNIPPERIEKFAVLEFDENEHLTKIVEKPETVAENSFVSMNAWIFSPKIFEACEKIEISPRGEFELTAAVMFAVERLGEKFKVIESENGVLDLSSRADIASVAEYLRKLKIKS